jgi:inner membrane protein
MDAATHLLVGFALARTGPGKAAPLATPALLAASVVSDLEVVHLVVSPENYLFHSGGWGHSLLGGAGLAAATAFAFWWFARRKAAPNTFIKLLTVALLGITGHILLDWATSMGLRLLWPFRQKLFFLDWLPSTDLLLIVILLAALLLPSLFRLIAEEIGAPKKDTGLRWGAVAGLAGCLLLTGARGVQHAEALGQLEARQYRTGPSLKEAAFPTPMNPFLWRGVADTGNTVEVVEVNLLTEEFDPLGSSFKPASHPALEAAQNTSTARLFLRRARFPLATVARRAEGWRVEMEDLRFSGGAGSGTEFALRIDLDKNHSVVEERIRWGNAGSWAD